jgi:DNA-binding MarR family transcriptional regulator
VADTDNDNPDRDDNLTVAAEVRETLRSALHMIRMLEYPGELSTTQVSILNTVAGQPHPMGLLARRSGMTQPGMSQQVARLEKAGLLRREPDPDDARVALVTLTDLGAETRERVNRERNAVLARYFDELDEDARVALRAGLGPLARLSDAVVQREVRGTGPQVADHGV